MTPDLNLLRQKEAVGIAAAVAWVAGLLTMGHPHLPSGVLIATGWFLTAAWVWKDARYRNTGSSGWGLLTLFLGPLGLLLYWLGRPAAPLVCSRCGAPLASESAICRACGHQSLWGTLAAALNPQYSALRSSLTSGPIERMKQTTRQLAIAFGVAAALGWMLRYMHNPLLNLLMVLSFAAYWVLLPRWVYLDAIWRRMDPTPWAIMTLVTNIFGLVTYVVVRYPEPRTCGQCGAALNVGLKRCPYCGTEVEATCPRCQAAVRPDWLFCPSCAAQLPPARAQQPAAPPPPASPTTVTVRAAGAPEPPAPPPAPEAAPPTTVTVRGTVVDAATGSPVPGALVRVDSRSESPSVETDLNGRFELPDLPLRPHVLLASAEGYAAEAAAYRPGEGAPVVNFSLRSAASPVETAPDAPEPSADEPVEE